MSAKLRSIGILEELIFFVGPEKTGTTFIYRFLLDFFPHYLLPGSKEKFSLLSESGYLEVLELLEQSGRTARTICIIEPSYYCSPTARENIRRLTHYVRVKVVHTSRDPVERAISHYLHHKVKGRCKTVDECFRKFPEFIKSSNYRSINRFWSELPVVFIDIDMLEIVQAPEETLLPLIGEQLRGRFRQRYEIINKRQAPRSMLLAKFLIIILDFLRKTPLKALTHGGIKNAIKNRVMYGGRRYSATVVEKNFIKERLENFE